MGTAGYAETIDAFLRSDPDAMIGTLSAASHGAVEQTQIKAWRAEISLLGDALASLPASLVDPSRDSILLEYPIPRMGSRIDAVLLFRSVVIVLEFKVGERIVTAAARDQVWDYALDLKNFHEPSHRLPIAPILVLTGADEMADARTSLRGDNDGVYRPVAIASRDLAAVLHEAVTAAEAHSVALHAARRLVHPETWPSGRYLPTPTIIEAALALYRGHAVAEISRSDAGARNLTATTDAISTVIERARNRGEKALCLVTGVPGAGKTLLGLNIATRHLNADEGLYSVFLSGNGPLVSVLQEALARDRVARARQRGARLTKGEARSEVKAFIQNVHHYRDTYLSDPSPPADHVALFDEAQRAWNLEQTSRFMAQKRGRPGFDMSEPEFLISCVDRHDDWGVIVGLVGGGQEINTGEVGIAEWLRAVEDRFPHWHVYVSDRLTESEYQAHEEIQRVTAKRLATVDRALHLGVSIRSFRAEHLSELVRQILDMEVDAARRTLQQIRDRYPIVITRDLDAAREWMRHRARGTERYGIVASSYAERLKPLAIDVRTAVNPVNWFLADKSDVRSSYYCEDVATEFMIQGLELDWACVTWDADFIPREDGWEHRQFRGNRWIQVKKDTRRRYLKNAYRVLLTRARQGMVIAVPAGNPGDPTRDPAWYDAVWDYLTRVGFPVLERSAEA